MPGWPLYGDYNSVLHTCVTSILPTESAHQPLPRFSREARSLGL